MTVTDVAILKIKEMIISGTLAPGDRLPPEKELAESLGLSRSSLREAVKALEVIRVLDVRRGDGTYVTSLEPGLLLEALSFVVDLHDDQSILELFAVRRILEPAAARIAAQRVTEDDLSRLRTMLDSQRPDTDVEVLIQSDIDFHAEIAACSGNTYLAQLLDSLHSGTARARIWRAITQDGAVERTLHEHRAIFEALEARDGELVEALTIAHVAGIERWLTAM